MEERTETWQWWFHVLYEAIAEANKTGRRQQVYSVKQRGPWGAPWEYFMREAPRDGSTQLLSAGPGITPR